MLPSVLFLTFLFVQTYALHLVKLQDVEAHWVYFEHFSRSAGTTMNINVLINGYRGYGQYDENKPWLSQAMGDIRSKLKDMTGESLYQALSQRHATYLTNEDAPVDFLGLEKYIHLKKITMMREPTSRIKSLIVHHIMPGSSTRMDNEYVRRLIGDSSGQHIPKITQEHFEQARKVLAHFDAVLIFEDFHESYNLLSCKFQWCVITDLDGHNVKEEVRSQQLKNCANRLTQEDQMEVKGLQKHLIQQLDSNGYAELNFMNTDLNEEQKAIYETVDTTYDQMLYKFAVNINKQQRAGCLHRDN